MKNYFRFFIHLYFFIGLSLAKAGAYEDFFKAIHFDQDQVVANLIARGIDPNTPNEKGVPALIVALTSGAPKTALFLAKHPQTKVDDENSLNETPLMLAAFHNHLEVCEVLIEREADVNRKGWTPLHYAASKGNIAIMRLLLEENAYIDAESPNGTTPLMMAAYYGSPLSVKLLLEEGADPNLRNHGKASALDLALSAERAQSAAYIKAFLEAWQVQELKNEEAAKRETEEQTTQTPKQSN
jgi:ankyrin repeat protein